MSHFRPDPQGLIRFDAQIVNRSRPTGARSELDQIERHSKPVSPMSAILCALAADRG